MSEINNYEERIAALETLTAQLMAEKEEMSQALVSMNERIAILEAIILPDNEKATPREDVPSEEAEPAIPARADDTSDVPTAASLQDNSSANTVTDSPAEEGSDQSLEDKYASDDDTAFDPSALDPELLKFFEQISNETKNTSAPAPETEVSDQPAAAPVPKKILLRRPGFHLYNWFYFSNPKDHGYLYRMREDETEQERMTDYAISMGTFKFKDGRLYFKDANWSEKSIKLSAEALNAYDLENEIDLASLKISGFKYNGWIYYANSSMGNFLYRIREDGTLNERLTDYSLPKSQNFRVLANKLNFYDDFLTPHQLPVRS